MSTSRDSTGTPSQVISSRERWNVPASDVARRTRNPIRSIVESLVVEPNPAKSLIPLSIGDPTTFGNLRPPREAVDAVRRSLESGSFNGYAASVGHLSAREAVAEYSSGEFVKVEAKDVILCSGCSGALDLCITALARRGQSILIPRPGFSIYRTLAEGLGVNAISYELRPDRRWEIDLDDLESRIDESTAAIVVNNPSNPCGSVFTREHTLDILDVAARYYVPIIADEIYEHMVFPGRIFHSLASLSRDVPILSCSGLTKRFLVPGWRMGWIIVHDRRDVLEKEIRKALSRLSQRTIGSNTLVQGALPAILKNTPRRFHEDLMAVLHAHSILAYDLIAKIPGLRPTMPDGAMYMMVRIDLACFPEFESDREFVQRLLTEESVFCLPGQCFDYPSYMRLVITVPATMLEEACRRILEFSARHHCKTAAEEALRSNSIVAEIPNY